MNELVRRLGAKLKQHRQARGLSQAQLGDQAGSSEEWVRKVERGEGSPSLEMIGSLCAALNIAPAELFDPTERSKALALLMAELDCLNPDEVAWVLTLVQAVKDRPGRG